MSDVSFSSSCHLNDTEGVYEEIAEFDEENWRKEVRANTHYALQKKLGVIRFWKKIVNKRFQTKEKEVIILKKSIISIMKHYFCFWRALTEKAKEASVIGDSLLFSRCFYKWKYHYRYIVATENNAYKVMINVRMHKLLLYFKIWQYYKYLNNEFKKYHRIADKLLMKRCFNGILNLIERKKDLQRKKGFILENSRYFMERSFFDYWTLNVRLNRLKRVVERKTSLHTKDYYFQNWVNRKFKNIRSRKLIKKFVLYRLHKVLADTFYNWYLKYENKINITESFEKVKQRCSFYLISRHFYYWFDEKQFRLKFTIDIETTKNKLGRKKTQHLLNKWYNIVIQRERLREEYINISHQLNISKINKLFDMWYTRYSQSFYERTKISEIRETLSRTLLMRSFTKWKCKQVSRHNNRYFISIARTFRTKVLYEKVFEGFYLNAKNRKRFRSIRACAERYRRFRLTFRAFSSWLKSHRKTAFRVFLVNSVIKSWKKSKLTKGIKAFKEFRNHKIKKRQDIAQATNIFERRCNQAVIRSFIHGSGLHYPVTDSGIPHSKCGCGLDFYSPITVPKQPIIPSFLIRSKYINGTDTNIEDSNKSSLPKLSEFVSDISYRALDPMCSSPTKVSKSLHSVLPQVEMIDSNKMMEKKDTEYSLPTDELHRERYRCLSKAIDIRQSDRELDFNTTNVTCNTSYPTGTKQFDPNSIRADDIIAKGISDISGFELIKPKIPDSLKNIVTEKEYFVLNPSQKELNKYEHDVPAFDFHEIRLTRPKIPSSLLQVNSQQQENELVDTNDNVLPLNMTLSNDDLLLTEDYNHQKYIDDDDSLTVLNIQEKLVELGNKEEKTEEDREELRQIIQKLENIRRKLYG